MPKFHEVFCETNLGSHLKSKLTSGDCPLSYDTCDGGGNRHQTKLNAADVSQLFLSEKQECKALIPAICSLDYGDDIWVVCPRRLFAFPKNLNGKVDTLKKLNKHEREILFEAGYKEGDVLGVWPEVYLKYSSEESEINYHFDYVVSKIEENTLTLGEFLEKCSAKTKQEINYIKKGLRENGLINPRAKDSEKILYSPNLDDFCILEVMTASTSGSNTSKGTDIKSVYKKMLNDEPYDCPGINKRQVWGRMATQLFAKSALAEHWGAKTYWVVQDKLLNNIALTTKLRLGSSQSSQSLINFIELSYSKTDLSVMNVSNHFNIDAGIDFKGDGTCADILLAKESPSKADLLKCMAKTKLAAVFTL